MTPGESYASLREVSECRGSLHATAGDSVGALSVTPDRPDRGYAA